MCLICSCVLDLRNGQTNLEGLRICSKILPKQTPKSTYLQILNPSDLLSDLENSSRTPSFAVGGIYRQESGHGLVNLFGYLTKKLFAQPYPKKWFVMWDRGQMLTKVNVRKSTLSGEIWWHCPEIYQNNAKVCLERSPTWFYSEPTCQKRIQQNGPKWNTGA